MEPFVLCGTEVKPGETKRLELTMPPLYTATSMGIPVHVQRGKRPGPTLFVSAAIHGDELNGIEIIARLLKSKAIAKLRGTLIAVPMVNVYGVLNQSRYLPDRRDLNRSFPGSKKGSLAGRIANLFFKEIVTKVDYGIDLHTGAIHRSNLPQIRASLKDDETTAIAKAFGVPVILDADIRDGSLRQVAADYGVKMVLYEAGQALRYDEICIRAGVKGIINVMRQIGMLNKSRAKSEIKQFIAKQSGWVRANESGFVNHVSQLGDHVDKDQVIAVISDPYGTVLGEVKSPAEGVVVGKQNIPLVQEGEAIYHIAYFHAPDSVAEHVEMLMDNFKPNDTPTVE
ncbi:MAG: succinylglutamate desuccinylase/aspartoacylase family protein [Aestuariibacter sp.]